MWDLFVNDNSLWLQCSEDMNKLHSPTATDIEYQNRKTLETHCLHRKKTSDGSSRDLSYTV